jgi:transcriptional regulator with XRE-family HTH domain
MSRLNRLAFTLKEWFEECNRALQDQNYALSDFPVEQFLEELSDTAIDDKKTGIDPEPLLASLATITRRHNKKVVQELKPYLNSSPQVTVERLNLFKRIYSVRLEAAAFELLYRARIANILCRLRNEQKKSLRQLEKQSGVSFSYLSLIERLTGSLPSAEILARLDNALSTPNMRTCASLLAQRNGYDSGIQLVQHEEARFSSALLQLIGWDMHHLPAKRTLPYYVRESAESSGWMIHEKEADKNFELDQLASGTDIGSETINMPEKDAKMLTNELCAGFCKLSPEMQKTVLSLVEELARGQEARREQ